MSVPFNPATMLPGHAQGAYVTNEIITAARMPGPGCMDALIEVTRSDDFGLVDWDVVHAVLAGAGSVAVPNVAEPIAPYAADIVVAMIREDEHITGYAQEWAAGTGFSDDQVCSWVRDQVLNGFDGFDRSKRDALAVSTASLRYGDTMSAAFVNIDWDTVKVQFRDDA